MVSAAFITSVPLSSVRAGMQLRKSAQTLRSRRRVNVTTPRSSVSTLPPISGGGPGGGGGLRNVQPNPDVFNRLDDNDGGLTWERLKRFVRDGYRLTVPFLREDKGARLHFLLVLFMTGLFTGVGLLWTMGYGNLMTAMSEKSGSAIMKEIGKLVCLLAFVVPTSVINTYVNARFRMRWTRYMTERLLGLYFTSQNYYKINTDSTQIDNPDEVIYDQIPTFTSNAFYLITDNISTVFDACAYSWLLIRLSPSLFFLTIAICVVSTLLINRIGKKLFALEALHIQLQANFRFALARVRIFAESIAFYGGDRREEEVNRRSFNTALQCNLRIIALNRWINAFERTFGYLPIMIPIAYLTPAYLRGTFALGQITQATQSFNILAYCFAFFVKRYDWLVNAGASLERLTRFADFVNREVKPELRAFEPLQPVNHLAAGQMHANGVTKSEIITNELPTGNELTVANVTLYTPGSSPRVLVRDVDLRLNPGERLLIVGASGIGKTSFLRAIAGLWTAGSGSITRPEKKDAFFMPQRPYCVLGSLREQLTYPHDEEHSDEALLEALSCVGLAHLASRDGGLDAIENWADVLSVGETQRIAFARLALSDAKLVIIDEGTSALDAKSEEHAMAIVQRKGRIVVSVGHRPSLVKFHDFVLSIEGGSKWSVQKAKDYVHPAHV